MSTILLLSIVIPITIVLAFASALAIHFILKAKSKQLNRGTKVFKVDYKSMKTKVYDEVWNKRAERALFHNVQPGKWLNINVIFKKFGVETFGKKLAKAVIAVKKNDDVSDFQMIISLSKKKNLLVCFSLSRTEGSEYFNLISSWKRIVEKTATKTSKEITKEEIINDRNDYKLFLAFNVNTKADNTLRMFSEDFITLTNKMRLKHIITKDLYIFYASSKNLKQLTNKRKRSEKIVANNSKTSGTNRLFDGTSYTVTKDVNTPKRLNTVLAFLDFGINVSIRKSTPFINVDSESFSKEEYDAFVEASSKFRMAIKTSEISVEEIPMKKYSSNRKILSYAAPRIKTISIKSQKTILRNSNNKTLLMDKFADLIAIKGKVKTPILVDVNQKWLEENYKKIQYKKAVYIINLDSHNKLIDPEIIDYLKENKILIAIKINFYNEGVLTLIENAQPEFIIAASEISQGTSSSGLINLITIKRIARANQIRLIHENPPKNIEPNMEEKIGIEYMYYV